MTVPATPRRAGPFNGNGVTTSFPFTFKVFSDEDLLVVLTDDGGLESELVLDTDYSVTLNPDQDSSPGGTITYPVSGSPLAVGSTLSAVGNLDYDQPLDLPGGGNFNPVAIENELDRLTMQMQQLVEQNTRQFTLPVGVDPDDINVNLPAPEGDQFLAWNATGTALVNRDAADLASVIAYANWDTDVFDGTGAQTAFTLSADPGTVHNCDVAIAGVVQTPVVDFTVSGTTLTFTSAPPSGAGNVVVRYGQALPVGTANATAVVYTAPATGAVARTSAAKHAEHYTAEDFGAAGDGVTDDTVAFGLAAAIGRRVHLRDGATYLLSSRVSLSSGSGFVCRNGYAAISLKTGAGGFDSTDLTTGKNNTNKCVFYANAVDDVEFEGLRFAPDGVSPAIIFPIRVTGGTSAKGVDISRLHFENFPMLNGGLVSLNTIGAGSYRVRDISAKSCGTSTTTWTGTPQITVVEVDNDMVASTPSVHGFIENVRGIDVAFSGTALSTYGQQTDVVNIAGISGTDRKGPMVLGVYGENVGEVVDLFCSHAIVKGVRGRNVYNFGVKLIHGARWNDVELETIENWGAAAVTFQGSSALAVNTEHNHVRVGSARQGATIGAFGDVPVVLFGANGGTPATCLPKSNVCTIGSVFGDGVNLDYVVRDGSASNAYGNLVEVCMATGWAVGFCSAPPANCTVRYRQNPRTLLTVGVAQTLTTNTWTKVAVDTVGADTDGGGDTVNNRVRCRFPGPKLVRGSIRVGLNAGDDVEMRLMLNGAQVGYAAAEPQSGGLAYVYTIQKVVYIDENAAGLAAADLTLEARVVSAGAISINNVAAASYLEVTDLG